MSMPVMNAQRAVRWSGSGICNGRMRLARSSPSARFYHLQSRGAQLRPSQLQREHANTSRIYNAQQTRSISIFGWGSSSKKGADEFAAAHGSLQAGPSKDASLDTSSSPSIEPVRSVKASHNTSDTPDPSSASVSTEYPHTSEPSILKDLENAIATPYGSPPLVEDASRLAATPEYIGYLKEICGLDYGWGMTAMLETALETMHITGGLSWTVSILGIAAVARTMVFLFIYRGADQSRIIKEISPIITPIKNEIVAAQKAGDQRRVAELSQEMRAINKEAGFRPVLLFVPVVVQMWVGISAFRMLRAAAVFPVPAFTTEQWLWNIDLTQSDPYYILPLVQAGVMYLTLNMGSMDGGPMAGNIGRYVKLFLPGFTAVFIAFQPGTVQLYMLASSCLAYLQTVVLSNNFARQIIGLRPNPPKVDSATPTLQGDHSGPKVVAGMTQWRAPTPGSQAPVAPKPEESAPKRSVIDRMVDPAKGKWDEMKAAAKVKAAETVQQRKQRERDEKAQKHEYRRREEIRHEREHRNQMLVQQKSELGPGGMKILKEGEKRRRR